MEERISEKRPLERQAGVFPEEYGLLVQEKAIESARYGGVELFEATRSKDLFEKIDTWLVDRRKRVCLRIQISTNPELMRGEKGIEVIRRGGIPWFIPKALAEAILEDPRKAGPKAAQSLLSAVEKSRKVLGNLLAEVPMSQIIFRK